MRLRQPQQVLFQLKFTPLEFETPVSALKDIAEGELKFTPLEFETYP